jgi:GTP-binding protein
MSVPKCSMLPSDEGYEVAFAGRSNSGKSSALNVLCGQKKLARTSRTPGRTQHLVVFNLDSERRLMDLPGFGYAKVAKGLRSHWEQELPDYLESRQSLAGLVMLMDVRHPLKPQEEVLIEWCSSCGVSMRILINKADKVSRGEGLNVLSSVNRRIAMSSGTISAQLFSATKQQGVEDAWCAIEKWLFGVV